MATKTAKPKQKTLPDMGQQSNPKIERLADRYAEARDKWQALHKPMTDAQDLLYAAMIEASIKAYEMPDGRMVEIVASEKVKVRRAKGGDDEE